MYLFACLLLAFADILTTQNAETAQAAILTRKANSIDADAQYLARIDAICVLSYLIEVFDCIDFGTTTAAFWLEHSSR